jgi:hypothetical protein
MDSLGKEGRIDIVNDHDPNQTPNANFPNLTPSNHRVIGPGTPQFNCIAWSCGETHRWWQPGILFYWPIVCDPNDSTLTNLVSALTSVGFVLCADGSLELGFEKVAVYALGPMEYTHAARQMPSGKWTSKLGLDVLIDHDTPESLVGGVYGDLFYFFKRPLTSS